MSSRIVVTAAALLAGGLLVGGCSTGGSGGQSMSAERGGGGSAADRLLSKGGGGGAKVTLAPQDRSVIYTARLTVRVGDATKARHGATSIVTKAHGYTARERTSKDPDGDGATSRLTLKVPVDRYPVVLHRLSTQLGNQLSLKRRARDVTEKVADVDSRVRSARATIDQLRTLLGKADTVGEVLKVEKRLSKREADLEALEARQKALDTKTSYATITLRLKAPAATHVKEAGFLSGLSAGWAAFKTTVVWLLTALGAVAPFVLILGAVAYGSWRGYRLVRRRRPSADT
ncbi:MAG: DUF4349 domain-containing protein [Streptosporangiales bacterium]